MAKLKKTPDTLKNFSTDFEDLKNSFFAYATNILQIGQLIYLSYHPKGKISDSAHMITLRDGMRSYANFHDDSSKNAEVRIEYSDGKITLSERSSPGSIRFNEKKSWTSLEMFKKDFIDFLAPKKLPRKKRWGV